MASTKIKSLSLNGVTWIQSGYGTPNHISVKGTLYIDLETAIEYINKDGLAIWGEYYDSTYIDSILTGISGTDIYITGGTYSSGTTIMTNNSGGTFNVTGYTYIPHLQYNNTNSTIWNYGSGNISGNISFGEDALASITNGDNNSAFGSSALNANTTGDYNTAIGNGSLTNNSSGVQNFGIGSYALYYNTTGNYNTAIGTAALQDNINAERNVAIGGFSLYRNTGSRNIAIGFYAGVATKGSDNILLGANANNTTDGVVSGSNNTIIGTLMSGVVNGSNNTIFGKPTGLTGTTTNNVIIADGSGNIRFRDNNVNTILPRLAGTGNRMIVASPSGELSARTIVDTFVTGGTFTTGTTVFTNSSGGTFNVTGYTMNNWTLSGSNINNNNSGGVIINSVLSIGTTSVGSLSGLNLLGNGSTAYGGNANNPGLINLIANSGADNTITGIQGGDINYGNVRAGIYFQGEAGNSGRQAIVFRTNGGLIERLRIGQDGIIKATSLVKYNSDLSLSYDSRTLVDKQYVDDRLLNFSEFRIYLNPYVASLSYIGGSWTSSGTLSNVNIYTGRFSSTTATQTIGIRNHQGGNLARTTNSLFGRFSIGSISGTSFLHFGYGSGSGAFPADFTTSTGIGFGFSSGDTTFSIKYLNPSGSSVSINTTIPVSTDTYQVKFLKSASSAFTYTIYNETTTTKVTGQVTTAVFTSAESLCISNGSSGQAITLDFNTLINKAYYDI